MKAKYFRDVSTPLKWLRDILLGRKHTLHNRFHPDIAPRTIPPPDIPRGPDYRLSKQFYCNRPAYDSVRPPVVAPVAEGGNIQPDMVCFNVAPTPGDSWWWDGHFYYDCVYCPPETCPPSGPACPPPTPDPPCKTSEPCPPTPEFPPPCPRPWET